jgi:hypothetical protein
MAADEYTDAEKRIEWFTFALGLTAALVAIWRWGWRAGLGLALGSVLSWINFRWLRTGISTLARLSSVKPGEEPPRVSRMVYAKSLGRFVLLLVVVYVILSRSLLPAGAVLAGLFAVVAAVLIEIVYELVRGTGSVAGH